MKISDLTIEKALSELDRFSLIRLTSDTVSVHRLLQAVQQDSLSEDECKRWIGSVVQLFSAFAENPPEDVPEWGAWPAIQPHAEAMLEQTKRYGVDTLWVARFANRFGHFLSNRVAYAQALAIGEKAIGPENPAVAESLNNLAYLYWEQGQYAKAEALYQRSLAMHEKAFGPDHPDVTTILNNLTALYNY